MTNRHVAALFAKGAGRAVEISLFKPGLGCRHRLPARARSSCPVRLLKARSYRHDPSLLGHGVLEVRGLPATREPLQLSLRMVATWLGREIVTVGYPGYDPRNDGGRISPARRCSDAYGVKRMQPGKLHAPAENFESSESRFGHISTIARRWGAIGVGRDRPISGRRLAPALRRSLPGQELRRPSIPNWRAMAASLMPASHSPERRKAARTPGRTGGKTQTPRRGAPRPTPIPRPRNPHQRQGRAALPERPPT